jgi:glutamyl-tRNA reductase
VVGTGEVGEGVARCLYDYGLHATVVVHRQIERAQDVARRYTADIATWDELPRQLEAADVVISSTSAPHTILQREHVQEAISRRPERPLYLIDLAVPRDIDPSAADLPGVYLHNIDDLQAVVRTTLEERRSALPQVERMVQAEVREVVRWLNARSTFPAIKTLREQADEVREREVRWALAKMPDLSEREREIVQAMAARIMGKLLHGPIQWIKAQAESDLEPDYGMSTLDPRQFTDLFLAGSDDGIATTEQSRPEA